MTSFVTGSRQQTSCTAFMCVFIFASTDGASHPLFFDFTRFRKRGFLYLVLRLRLDLRSCRLVESRPTMSARSSTSAS